MAEGGGNRRIHDDDKEGDPVHAGHRGDLDEGEKSVLGVSEEGPREARQQICPREFQGDPEASRQQNTAHSRGGPQPDPARRKHPHVDGQVQGEEEQEEEAQCPGEAAVHRHGVRDPREVQGIKDHPGQRPDPESRAARGPLQGHEERHQRHERKRPQGGGGKAQKQAEPGEDREESRHRAQRDRGQSRSWTPVAGPSRSLLAGGSLSQ